MRVHHYQMDPSNGPDYKDRYRCMCGMPEEHAVHSVPDLPEGDVSDRIIGEGTETVDT